MIFFFRKIIQLLSRRDPRPDRPQERTREEPDPPIPRVVGVGVSSSSSQAGAMSVAASGQLVISAPTKDRPRYVEAVEVPRHTTYVKENLRE